MKEQLINSFEFIENLGDDGRGISYDKLEKLAQTFEFDYDPEILLEMVK